VVQECWKSTKGTLISRTLDPPKCTEAEFDPPKGRFSPGRSLVPAVDNM
jgi:hypothetical protein